MTVTRREFVQLTAAGLASGLVQASAGRAAAAPRGIPPPKAIAFDAFPIFDPRPVGARAESLFPGHGAALTEEWRLRQFEYAWLRALSRDYADFWSVTRDALVFATRRLKLELDTARRDALMEALVDLAPWPDVVPALAALEEARVRIGFLSNFTARMLEANLGKAGLRSRFEHVVSTDRARTYKPDPRAYELGTEAFGLRREDILFVAHAGWDAAGAKRFGYPTFWVNRAGLPAEELGVSADATGRDLSDLVAFVTNGPRAGRR